MLATLRSPRFAPLPKDQAVYTESLIESGAEEIATAAIVSADGLLTGTALPLLPEAPLNKKDDEILKLCERGERLEK